MVEKRIVYANYPEEEYVEEKKGPGFWGTTGKVLGYTALGLGAAGGIYAGQRALRNKFGQQSQKAMGNAGDDAKRVIDVPAVPAKTGFDEALAKEAANSKIGTPPPQSPPSTPPPKSASGNPSNTGSKNIVSPNPNPPSPSPAKPTPTDVPISSKSASGSSGSTSPEVPSGSKNIIAINSNTAKSSNTLISEPKNFNPIGTPSEQQINIANNFLKTQGIQFSPRSSSKSPKPLIGVPNHPPFGITGNQSLAGNSSTSFGIIGMSSGTKKIVHTQNPWRV
jgi:hypothetical protein